MDVEVTIGWTRSEVGKDESGREYLVYSSFGDGYKHGASQHTETITLLNVEADDVLDLDGLQALVEKIAEACFAGTNNPYPTGLAAQVQNEIAATGYRGQGAHYSLSTGDTVTVGEVMLECAAFGWKRVEGAVSA